MTINNILWFREVSDLNLNLVGNKALSICKIFNNNIAVPNGFCIPHEVFYDFQEETKIKEKIEEILTNLDVNNLNSLYSVSEKLQNLILSTNIPAKLRMQILEAYENINIDIDVYKMAGKNALEIIKAGRETPYVAVRISPMNNNLNNQPNIMNIKGKEEVIKAIQKCWASMFTPNSLNIKIKNKIPLTDGRVTVIVQKMIDSEKSGIIYTINPENHLKNEIVIEACLGQGEVMSTGSIIPDKYVIDKETQEIKEKSINKQDFMLTRDDNIGRNIKKNLFNNEEQKLTDQEINKILNYGLQIEDIYKSPQEIEFCVSKDKIFILQSRPIIISYSKEEYTDVIDEELSKKEQNILVRGLNASLGTRNGYVNIIRNSDELNNLKENQVLVIKSGNYINLNLLDSDKLRKLAGVVTDNDNLDSPLARIARDFGIPCIVSTTDATRMLKQDQLVTIDGNTGVVYEERKLRNKLIDYYETATEVKVLIDSNEILPDSERNNGIGILKINLDYFYLNLNKDELLERISKDIESKIELFKNKSVWYYVQTIDNYDLLKIQLDSIKKLHDKGITNIGVAIPSVTDVSQIKKIKEMLKEIDIEPLEEIEFGLIIDTPAAAILINEFCEEQLDFIIIDLLKLTTATLNLSDEYNEKYNESHPSVLKQISHITKTCRKSNTETSIIGKSISEPEFVEFLVRNGADSLICKINAVNETKTKIAKSEKKLILKAVRNELNSNSLK